MYLRLEPLGWREPGQDLEAKFFYIKSRDGAEVTPNDKIRLGCPQGTST